MMLRLRGCSAKLRFLQSNFNGYYTLPARYSIFTDMKENIPRVEIPRVDPIIEISPPNQPTNDIKNAPKKVAGGEKPVKLTLRCACSDPGRVSCEPKAST